MSANIIIGRNAVRQHLQSNQHIEKLYLRDRQSMNDGLRQIIQTAKKQRIQIQWLHLIVLMTDLKVTIKALHALRMALASNHC